MGKNIFSKYAEYLKDNPQRYWFKRKVYGWGWIPATKEGWFVILAFLLLVFGISYNFSFAVGDPTSRDLTFFFGQLIITLVVLLLICYKKGEPPKWSWGFEK